MKVKKVISLYLGLSMVMFSSFFSGCSQDDKQGEEENEQEQNLPVKVILSADKEVLKSNGIDFITFSVKADNVDVSTEASIICSSAKNKKITLTDNTDRKSVV